VTGLFTLPGLGFGSSGIVTHGVTDVDTAKWDVPVEAGMSGGFMRWEENHENN
jgi:hypothetical protein